MQLCACSKSENTSYQTPDQPSEGARLVKFAYTGHVFGMLPEYTGLKDTPSHQFSGTGITESQFVATEAGDTIGIILALASEETWPVVTVTEPAAPYKEIPPLVSAIPSPIPDGTTRFRVIIK